jgi:hypothetical protein
MELGIEPQRRPIVTWPDPEGADLQKLVAAGIRASGRAGRLRAAFHIWNDLDDVELVVQALRKNPSADLRPSHATRRRVAG